jgi:hypothetical protein
MMAVDDYERYMVKTPATVEEPDPGVKNRTYPPLIYMSSGLVPGVRYNVEFGWVWGMPEPNPCLGEEVGGHDEIILNIGGDCRDPEDLGADIEYTLGGQKLETDSTGALFVPKGVPHGPLTYKAYRHPHVRISILLGTGERGKGNMRNPEETGRGPDPGVDYARYLVRRPTYEVIAGTPIKNRQSPSSMTFMNRNLVPECNIYVEGGWVWGMPDPNPHILEHAHRDFEELVLHYGTDYGHPEELCGEIEFPVGGQMLRLDRTSMVYVPKGVSHGPLVWKKYTAPHLEIAIIPGAGSLAEADPGGHQEKIQRNKSNRS